MKEAMQEGTASTEYPGITPDVHTLVRLKRMLLFTHEDEQYLAMAGNILAVHTETILDSWYNHMLQNNYLSHYFSKDGSGAHDLTYLQSLQPHFRKWIYDLCTRQEGHTWRQFEERVTPQLQQPDNPQEIAPLPAVYLRYLSIFIYPVTEAGRSYLAASGHSDNDIARMQQAWFKAVSFSTLLWSYPGTSQQDKNPV
ncbi:protoglobin domain-containing protein [Chitinophaga sp. 30R24]|uniref:protoglobin domain-containing protein n=1 Tax=Chitinophaga sp. 30R24 TaxID=3248838 RepID=UPI003B920032